MRIVYWQAILMKHHAFLAIFEKEAKFELVVCCKGVLVLSRQAQLFPSRGAWYMYFIGVFTVCHMLHCTILQRGTLSGNLRSHLLITFANSLTQIRTDPNCWHSNGIPERFFFSKS